VKIASPFGYSIFDLHDGMGFSFQIHKEPKLEAFHILRSKPSCMLYISDVAEWTQEGLAWAESRFSSGVRADLPFVLAPTPGDVARITETEVVHSVLGCVLEEYASCSVDAVERLFDQNERATLNLPSHHPDVSQLLATAHGGLPSRLLERRAGGRWQQLEFPIEEPIAEVGDEMLGFRRFLSGGNSELATEKDSIAVVVALDSPITLSWGGHVQQIAAGMWGLVPADRSVLVSSLNQTPTCIAVHQVSRRLVSSDWSR
jgi:hypothetical protein